MVDINQAYRLAMLKAGTMKIIAAGEMEDKYLFSFAPKDWKKGMRLHSSGITTIDKHTGEEGFIHFTQYDELEGKVKIIDMDTIIK